MRHGPPVTPENRAIAHYAAQALGGTPQVSEYLHESDHLTMDILWLPDSPARGVTTYATVGLSDVPMEWEEGIYPTRLELVGACASRMRHFGNILAAAAFEIMESKALHAPGDAIPEVVVHFAKKTTVPHLFLAEPYLWEETLHPKAFGSKQVAWLLAVPISDAELDFLEKNGGEELGKLLEKHQVDLFDLKRPSTIG